MNSKNALFSSSNLYRLSEPLILVAAILIVNVNFYREDIGFLNTFFHPFWLIIMFLAPRQRFPLGFISTAIVAGSYLFISYFRSSTPFFEFITTTLNIRLPILFLLLGYYLSLVRESFDFEIEALTEKNRMLEKHLEEIKEINTGISEDDKKNALKIFETSNTIKTVYQAASSLSSFNEDELIKSMTSLVYKFTESSCFAVYKIIEENKLLLMDDFLEGEREAGVPVIGNIGEDRTLSQAYESGKIVTVADMQEPGQKHLARSEVKIACPIKFKDTEEIFGFIIIFEIPFQKMNLETVNVLEMIASWTQSALVKSREMSEARSRSIEDELTMAYKYDYFKKRFSEEHSRAQRYNFDLSTVLVKVAGASAQSAEKNSEMLRLISIFMKTIVRDVDIVSRFREENFLISLLPSTDEKGAMMLIKRMKQAFPAFLKGSSLPVDSISLEYNYKVVYRKK